VTKFPASQKNPAQAIIWFKFIEAENNLIINYRITSGKTGNSR
jgi:hypothetical protein